MAHNQIIEASEDKDREFSLERAAITMAVAVVFKRLTELTQEDVQELYELAMELPKAKDRDETEAIRIAMLEILDQESGGVRILSESPDRPEKLQKWVDFIATKVQKHRKEAGLTQVQLAEKSGLPQSHISRIESAKLSPSRATLEKIASALGKKLGELDPTAQ